jgi:hypothetical protein
VPDEDVYYRRLHFGALQPVMAHTPYANSDPWRPGYGPDLVRAYRYWAWLHKQLVPYFYSYAYRMFESPGRAVLRKGPMARSLRGKRDLRPHRDGAHGNDGHPAAGRTVDRLLGRVARPLGDGLRLPGPLGREPSSPPPAIVPMDVEAPRPGTGRRSRGVAHGARLPERHVAFASAPTPPPWVTRSRPADTSSPRRPHSRAPVLYRSAGGRRRRSRWPSRALESP